MSDPMHNSLSLPSSAPATQQRGVSMVELLVGITIGLLVVVAAVGSLAFTQGTSTSVGDSARLQQKANSAFRVIGYQLRQTAGVEVSHTDVTAIASPLTDVRKVAYSQAFAGYRGGAGGCGANALCGVEGGGALPDTLQVSYEGSDPALGNLRVRDCIGNIPVAVPATVDNEFWLDNATDPSNPRLRCWGVLGARADSPTIIDGVEDFQVTYGVRVETIPAPPIAPPALRIPAVATYQQFDATGAAALFGNVNTVTVCLQLRGDYLGGPPTAIPVGGGCRGQAIAADGRLRRIYRATFSLRSTLS